MASHLQTTTYKLMVLTPTGSVVSSRTPPRPRFETRHLDRIVPAGLSGPFVRRDPPAYSRDRTALPQSLPMLSRVAANTTTLSPRLSDQPVNSTVSTPAPISATDQIRSRLIQPRRSRSTPAVS